MRSGNFYGMCEIDGIKPWITGQNNNKKKNKGEGFEFR
jgi:hypothetical protein